VIPGFEEFVGDVLTGLVRVVLLHRGLATGLGLAERSEDPHFGQGQHGQARRHVEKGILGPGQALDEWRLGLSLSELVRLGRLTQAIAEHVDRGFVGSRQQVEPVWLGPDYRQSEIHLAQGGDPSLASRTVRDVPAGPRGLRSESPLGRIHETTAKVSPPAS